MKRLTLKKMKIFFTACFAFLAIGATALFASPTSKHAVAEDTTVNTTLASNVYQTNGASVRVFNNKKQEDGTRKLVETDKKGIRFHVETGAGYQIAENTPLLDVNTLNEKNGSYKLADGYKTYTLILPSRLLNGDLTPATNKVMKIDTTEYWFTDSNGNWESVAYVYNVPESMYTDPFSYRGIICKVDGETETVVAQTEVSERALTYVAKMAYNDTIKEDHYWGSADLDDQAAPLIKQFVPTYSITYKDAEGNNLLGEGKMEEVLWGDTPQNVPANAQGSWYDTIASEEFNVNQTMSFTENRNLTLVTTSSNNFLLTGVAAQANYTVNETTYSGIKVYATLPTTGSAALAYNTELDIEAVNTEYTGTGTFNGIEGVWTMQEGDYMRLFFAFKEGTQLTAGDKILIKGDSVFYANGIMYKLTQDYTIDYNGGSDYGMFLGYLYNSDVKSIYNYSETRKDANGKDYTAYVIRVEFHKDVLINSNYTFVYDGVLPEGAPSPVYLKCGDDGKTTEIAGGFYHWNDGKHKIIELNGYGCGANNDEIHGIAGTKIVQNGGYYIFNDNMYAYYNGSAWVNGKSIGSFGISEFAATGENYTQGTNEVRINTNSRWWDTATQLTAENMSTTAAHAVYYTSVDGTVTPIPSFIFHGQEYTNSSGTSNHQIFGIRETIGKQAGDTITIVNGTRFWNGNEYYTFSDTKDLVLYYNGSYWVVDHDGTPTGTLDSTSFTGQVKDFNGDGDGIVKTRFFLNSEIFNTFNLVTVEGGSIKIRGMDYASLGFVVKYHAGGNKIIEIMKDVNTQAGLNAFIDTIVFEKGTRLWKDALCYEFSETVTFVYLGEVGLSGTQESQALTSHWAQSINTDVTAADVTRIYNFDTEIRVQFTSGILKNTYYGNTILDASTGLPIINGVEASIDGGFSYGTQNNSLFGIRNSGYGQNSGDTLIIPAGSVWWTTQGSITFTEEICAVYTSVGDSNWTFCHKNDTNLGTIDVDKIASVYNDGTEIRVKIPLEFSDTYYGYTFLDGEAYVAKKADGSTVSAAPLFWYGGQSTAYPNQDHSLIGFRGIIGETDGDQFIIPAGTKLFILNGSGYHTFDKDVIYTFLNGSWQAGDLTATVKTTVDNATVELPETDMFEGKEYTFTVAPESGYVISTVTANGTELALVDGNYTFTAKGGENNIVVTTKKLYTVTVIAGNSTVSGIANGEYADGTTVNFTVSPSTGYHVTSVTNATGSNGSYTVTISGNTTITVNTEINTYTVTLTTTSATVSGVTDNMTVTHGQEYSFTATAKDGYGLSSVTINGTEQGTSGSYSFTPTDNVTIVVTAKKLYAVTWSNPTGATISVTANGSAISSGATVLEGTSISVTATANSGYTVTNITANGTSIGTTSGSHTVTGATTIAATAKKLYTVTVNAGNSTVSGIANGEYVDGTTVNFTVSPSTGYHVTSVTNATGSNGSYTVTISGNTTITVNTEINTYTVTLTTTSANVSGVTNNMTVTHDQEYSFTATANDGYGLASVTINGEEKGTSGSYSFKPTDNVKIVVTAKKLYAVTWTNPDGATISVTANGSPISSGATVLEGTTLVVEATASKDYKVTNTSVSGATDNGDGTYTVTGATNITVTTENCLVEGTLITLADGTQKPVEDLTGNELLLVWNLNTGKYDAAPIIFVDSEERMEYTVVTLFFSNGSSVGVVSEHGFFDVALGKYVYLDEFNANEYIGHEFITQGSIEENTWSSATLVNVVIEQKVVKVYSPVTFSHLCYYVDGVLSMPGGIEGLFNIFEVDVETMSYDAEKMAQDIETYGLFTYEDFAAIIPVEVYEAFNGAWLKVAMGKGLIDWATIEYYAIRYLPLM